MTNDSLAMTNSGIGRARAAGSALATGVLALAVTIALPWTHRLFDLAPVAFGFLVPVLGVVGMGLAAYARRWLLFALNAAATVLFVPALVWSITLAQGP